MSCVAGFSLFDDPTGRTLAMHRFPDRWPSARPSAVSFIKALLKAGPMINPRTEWILSACWIAASLAVFFVIDASSTRSWLYLIIAAVGPPVALIALWPHPPQQSIDDVIHGRGERS